MPLLSRAAQRLCSLTPGLTLACAVLLGACASGPATATLDQGATLEVDNRTHEDVQLSVRGRAEAIVRSGARVRVRHLVPGDALVEARSIIGGPGAFRATTTLPLHAGRTAAWSVMPDAAGGEPLPPVPGFGRIQVVNPSRRDVSIFIDGVRVGRVFAGATRVFEDVVPGDDQQVHLVARPDDGTAETAADIALVPDTEVTWRFEQVGAELVVDNATDEALEVTIDGEPRGRVAPGATWTSREGPGLRLLQARSEPSRRPYEAVLVLSTEAPTTWRVVAGQSALRIENQTGEPIIARVPGLPPMPLDPHGEARFDQLATGPIALTAEGAHTRMAYAARLELMPGQASTWVVAPVAGSIRVENRTRKPLTVYTTLGGKDEERGTIAPDGVALIRDLPRTTIGLMAIEAGVPRRQTTAIDLSTLPAATWVVVATSGAVRVDNTRDEALDVYVDARRVGEIPARSTRTFTGLEVGERLVECVGRKTGVADRDRRVIAEDVLATVVVRDTTAWIVVDNTSGEALEPRGLIAEQLAVIPAGGSYRFKVGAGTQRVAFVGRDSGLAYAHAVNLAPGETGSWRVVLEPGRLLVWSRLDESAAVAIDGRAVGTLAPDDTLVLDGLMPGRHRVQLVGLRTGLVRAEDVTSTPAGDTRLTFATEPGVVLVENRAQEVVEVTIDGALYGTAAAGSIHAFGKVPPGPHEIELTFVASRRTQRVTLELREGQRARVVAEAPRGVLVVDNASHQDVRITLDGEVLAIVPAEAGPTLVDAPAGQRHIQITRLGDHSELGFELTVRADSAFHLPVPPRDVRLVVVNRGDVSLTLFAGEHRLGELGGRASMMFEEVPDGEIRLFAKTPDGAVSHEERRKLHAGETATWVLD